MTGCSTATSMHQFESEPGNAIVRVLPFKSHGGDLTLILAV